MKGLNIENAWVKRFAVVLLLLMVVTSAGQARWINLLNENFELWPLEHWANGLWFSNGHYWDIAATPGGHVWGVEENTIYHPGHPMDINSLWCAGLPNDLQAGVDFYPPNFLGIAYWGPFSLAEAVAASGNLYLFADLESNAFGSGDDFLIIVSPEPTDAATWDTLYVRGDEGTMNEWRPVSFDFTNAREHETGDSISVLGQEDLFFGIVFNADADQNVGFGAFVDDINFGYDNGEFDFERRSVNLEDPNDPNLQFQSLYVNTTVRIRGRFMAHGNYLSNEVTHQLIINDVVVDSARGQWQGSTYGQQYEISFDYLYTPTDTGTCDISFRLDVYGEQEEYSEENNVLDFSYPILAENAPPSITFIQPDADGAWAGGDRFRIIYEAVNTPANELAHVSFFYDTDLDPVPSTPVQGALGLPITSVQDTAFWYMGSVPDGEYTILAILDDYFHDTRQIYAQGTVTVNHTDVETDPEGLPEEFAIQSAYPNPFNPTVEIAFALPQRADVYATWYSVDGRQVDKQFHLNRSAGNQRISWTPHNLPSGVYLLNLKAGDTSLTRKVVYMK
ncbi:T9SS type A sorting domain-containing protein [bacterium]|nr:T9SS type A sorting domain-containing protein [bacterium]